MAAVSCGHCHAGAVKSTAVNVRQGVLQRGDTTVNDRDARTRTRFFPRRLHRRLVPGHVHLQAVLLRHEARQVHREAVCVPQLERRRPVHQAALACVRCACTIVGRLQSGRQQAAAPLIASQVSGDEHPHTIDLCMQSCSHGVHEMNGITSCVSRYVRTGLGEGSGLLIALDALDQRAAKAGLLLLDDGEDLRSKTGVSYFCIGRTGRCFVSEEREADTRRTDIRAVQLKRAGPRQRLRCSTCSTDRCGSLAADARQAVARAGSVRLEGHKKEAAECGRLTLSRLVRSSG